MREVLIEDIPQNIVEEIELMVEYDDSLITRGQVIMGESRSLDNDHIDRIRRSTQNRINLILSESVGG